MKVAEIIEQIAPEVDPLDHLRVIEALKKGRTSPLPDIEKLRKQYDPDLHDVMDLGKRPNRMVYEDDGVTIKKVQEVNRIPIPMQRTIVRTAVSFAFGNPLGLNVDGDKGKDIVDILKRVFHDNKTLSLNRTMGRDLFRATEVAEVWYTVVGDEPHNRYGFKTTSKIKVRLFSPWSGDELYPYFDETGDLIAFSRAFSRDITNEKKQKYFETYTSKETIRWKQVGSDWEVDDGFPLDNKLGRIPVIYGCQDGPEWEVVQKVIERLETLMSNHAEIIDYNADPKIFFKGNLISMLEKGRAGGIIQGDVASDAKYLSWEQAPEAVKLEIETLLRFIFSCTQTPDISFDSVKGLQQISGEALSMLFMDAHLKVQDKREILDAYFQRRINVCLAFIGLLTGRKSEADNLMIEPEITPYSIDNLKEVINNIATANGSKPIISQKTSVAIASKAGLIDDPDAEWEQIQKEQEADQVEDIFNPSQA